MLCCLTVRWLYCPNIAQFSPSIFIFVFPFLNNPSYMLIQNMHIWGMRMQLRECACAPAWHVQGPRLDLVCTQKKHTHIVTALWITLWFQFPSLYLTTKVFIFQSTSLKISTILVLQLFTTHEWRLVTFPVQPYAFILNMQRSHSNIEFSLQLSSQVSTGYIISLKAQVLKIKCEFSENTDVQYD